MCCPHYFNKKKRKEGKEIMKKILAILLSIMMVFCFMPGMAFAEPETQTSIENADVTLSQNSFTYGLSVENIKDYIKVKLNGTEVPKTEYTVSCAKTGNSTSITTGVLDVGKYTATVKAIDSSETYKGIATKTVEFLITPKSGLDSSISVSIDNAKKKVNTLVDDLIVYDSITQKPLTKGTDYTIPEDYKTVLGSSNNITLSFINNYSGNRNFYYTGVYDIKDVYKVSSPDQSTSGNGKITEYTYSRGVKRTASFTLIKNSNYTNNSSIPAADYEVIYSDNENVTGQEITATIKGKGNFTGEITDVKTGIKIVAKSLNTLSITVGNSTSANTAPPITIKDGSYTLIQGTDYTVDSPDSTNKTVTITGQGNYKDPVIKSFSIGKGIRSVSVDKTSFDYSGYDQRPNLTVIDSDGALVPANGYRVEWPADTKNNGRKEFKVIGIGAYAGEVSGSYTILKKDLSKCDISLSGTSFAYTGYAIKPAVAVKDSYCTLREGTDYTLVYSSNIAKGTASVTVTAKDNYSGVKILNFYIGTSPLQRCSISLDKTSYNYTGYEIKPTVKVTDGTKTVTASNYVVTYRNNTATGTATAVVTGKNDFYGVVELPFAIVGKTIENCTITVTPTSYTADGYEKRPSVTVKDGYKSLTEGKDYSVTYADNKIAGTASVIITGKGGYSGTVTKYFTIVGLKQTLTLEKSSYIKYPTSNAFVIPTPKATGDGTGFSYVSSDPSVVTVSANGVVTPIGPGEATITVTTIGVKRYEPVSKKITITVKPNRPQFKLTSTAKGRLKVSITKLSNVDGYQIKYTRTDTYKYFTYPHRFNDYKTQYKIFKGLKSNAKYKVQVRAYKLLPDGTKLYGNWMTVKTLKVK